ncbi:MAG: GDP-mannose 4,6-dehydratase [bacterium]|nr:GDP-mannose 4,6-dehydratase [bacterium]
MTFWENRNVFVTGATGLLGSWLIEELLNRRSNVFALVRDWIPRCRTIESGLLDRIGVVRGELEDYDLVLRALNEHEIDTVFHLGAQTIVGTAARSPRSTFDSNIRGTWNLLEACRECGQLVQRVVVASSDKAYGVHDTLPYTEDTPLQGRFPYDVSKSCADLIALSYHHTYDLPVAITRCGNLFGGGDLNFSRLVPATIRSALKNESPIIRSDGTFVRDYFYVRDAVDAYLQLTERLPDDTLNGQAFNFGTETPASVLEIVKLILELTGRTSLEPIIQNQASKEIPRQYLSSAKARELLDWHPRFSTEEGMRQTIDWYSAWLDRG